MNRQDAKSAKGRQMEAYGTDLLCEASREATGHLKLVLNEKAVSVFPSTEQHRDQRALGLLYADDSAGNALAATLNDLTLDIRLHRDFSEQRVGLIINNLLQLEAFRFLREGLFRYGGKSIALK